MESNETSIDQLRRSFCNSMRMEPGSPGEPIEVLEAKLGEDRGRSLKQDSLENFKCRLRRSQAFSSERRPKPLIARHPSATQLNRPGEAVKQCRTGCRPCRTPSPGQYSRRQPSPSFLAVSPRRRSSPGWRGGLSRACSPLCNNPGCRRRMPSPCFASCCSLSGVPGDATDAQRFEALKRRVRKAQRARFYLLQRPGPHSFSIGGDLPAKNKFKIIIGPQSCSCGHGPHCVHVLFVMLRVFQVSENDPRLFAKDLKNFEVDSLFEKYEERRKHQATRRIKTRKVGRVEPEKGPTNWSAAGKFSSVYESTEAAADQPRKSSTLAEEENLELCPICLLEMLDGEGLTSCKNGCRNQLHHHCISIWAEECRQQGEPVLCPLCRAVWADPPCSSSTSSSSGLGSSIASVEPSKSTVETLVSPSAIGVRSGSCRKKTSWLWRSSAKTPDSDAIEGGSNESLGAGCVPVEYRTRAGGWSRVYGTETVSNLFSKDWSDREEGLRQVNRHLSKVLTAGTNAFTAEWMTQVVKATVGILTLTAPDPVYKVYVGCMRVLRTLLSSHFVVKAASAPTSSISISSPVHHDPSVLRLLQPVLNSIVLKCADSNRRTSQLSLATLVELGKGAEGQLGAYVAAPGVRTAVEALLDCVILSSFPDGALEWQWILGRLLALEQLLAVFPHEFTIEYVPLNEEPNGDADGAEDSGFVLRNFNKIMAVQDFACSAVSNQHAVVARTARKLFVAAAQLCCDEPAAYNEVCVMLSKLDPNLRQRLQKKIKSPATVVDNPSVASVGVEAVAVAINERLHRLKLPAKPRSLSSRLLSPSPKRRFCRLVVKPAVTDDVKSEVLASDREERTNYESEPSWVESSDKAPLLPSRPTDLPLNDHQQQQGKLKRARWFQFQKMHLTKGHHHQQQPHRRESSPSLPSPRHSDEHETLSVVTSVLPILDAAASVRRKCRSSAGLKSEPFSVPHRPETQVDVVHCIRAEVVPLRRGLTTKASLLPSLPNWRPRLDEVLPNEPKESEGISVETLPDYHEGRDWLRGPLLGTGAFSSVYQAWDVATGTIMAVKQVSMTRNSKEEEDQIEEAMKAEISLMLRLDHPNVIRLTGASREGSLYNVFSEWMPGGSIAMLLEKYGAFSEPVIVRYIRQVVEGLAYLHDNNVLHRDLKGANLLVDKDGQTVKIGDFGAAAHLAANGGGTSSGELQGQLTGTVAFMAPEVLRGDNYGRRCDIWSVGCCVIEMATARPPWDQLRLSNHVALMFKIACAEQPPPVPDYLSPMLRDVALRCLALMASLRPCARDLLNDPVFGVDKTEGVVSGDFHVEWE